MTKLHEKPVPRKGSKVERVVEIARSGAGPHYISERLGMPLNNVKSFLQYAREKGYIAHSRERKTDHEIVRRFSDHLLEKHFLCGRLVVAASSIVDDEMWAKIVDRARAEGYYSLSELAMELLADYVLEGEKEK